MLRYLYADQFIHKFPPNWPKECFRDRADQFKTRLGMGC